MIKYNSYSEYKKSNVEWIGEIPSSWKIKKLKFLCDIDTGTKDTVDAEDDGIYPFFVRSQTVEKINTFTADCEAVLTAGDGVGVGKVFHYFSGKFDFHQRVYMMNNFKEVSGIYFYHYLSNLFHKVTLDGGAKSTVDSLRMPIFLNFYFTVPPPEDQKKIVEFLNYKTTQIDALIAKKEILLLKLQEKRSALITQAVTKGINPNVPMKPSGVEWLGDVPAHWDIKKLKFCLQINNGRDYKDVQADSGFPVYGSGGQFTFSNEYLHDGEAVLLGRKGTIDKPLYVNEAFWTVDTMYYGVPFKKYSGKFIFYCATCIPFSFYATDTALPSMTQTSLNNHKIAIPDFEEQKLVVEYIEKKTSFINLQIQRVNDVVQKLNEYRSALITNAVTGKIDVRDFDLNKTIS